MKLLWLLLMVLLACSFVGAEEINVPIGIEFGVSSITIKCANANYVYDKNSVNLSDNISCEQTVNVTVSNQSLNLSCDAQAIADAVVNKSTNGDLKSVVETLTSAYNDRTQQILNTFRDEVSPIRSAVADSTGLQNQLLVKQTEISVLQGEAAECRAHINATNARIAERDSQHREDKVAMLVLLAGVIVLVILMVSNFVLGFGKQVRQMVPMGKSPPPGGL